MEDLRLELRFKNAKLFNLIEDRFRGEIDSRYGCCSVAARAIGISPQRLNGYLTLRTSPWTQSEKGDSTLYLSKTAKKIADFFYADPEEVFPVSLYRIRLPRLAVKVIDSERYLSFTEARKQKLLPHGTQDWIQNVEAAGAVQEALAKLTPREQQVVKMRFGLDGDGERTCQEIADEFLVSRERIHQIEQTAMGKMSGSEQAA